MDSGQVPSPSDNQLDFDDDTLRGKKIYTKKLTTSWKMFVVYLRLWLQKEKKTFIELFKEALVYFRPILPEN